LAKFIASTKKSPDQRYARTASNKERRAAKRSRCSQKDALTFTSRSRYARRRARWPIVEVHDGE
jgi:hypothetical protein